MQNYFFSLNYFLVELFFRKLFFRKITRRKFLLFNSKHLRFSVLRGPYKIWKKQLKNTRLKKLQLDFKAFVFLKVAWLVKKMEKLLRKTLVEKVLTNVLVTSLWRKISVVS